MVSVSVCVHMCHSECVCVCMMFVCGHIVHMWRTEDSFVHLVSYFWIQVDRTLLYVPLPAEPLYCPQTSLLREKKLPGAPDSIPSVAGTHLT